MNAIFLLILFGIGNDEFDFVWLPADVMIWILLTGSDIEPLESCQVTLFSKNLVPWICSMGSFLEFMVGSYARYLPFEFFFTFHRCYSQSVYGYEVFTHLSPEPYDYICTESLFPNNILKLIQTSLSRGSIRLDTQLTKCAFTYFFSCYYSCCLLCFLHNASLMLPIVCQH